MIVGLTGGIGSGKSTVAAIFSRLGVPVYEADTASKRLIDTDNQLITGLTNLLGSAILLDGKIDKPKMASTIFNDKGLLSKTNELVHPAVAKDFKDWYKAQSTPYIIKEAAILFESGSYKQCDKIVVVTAPKEMRIERVIARNNTKREEVLSRMNNQWEEHKKVELADYIIKNDLTESLIHQVVKVHQSLLSYTTR